MEKKECSGSGLQWRQRRLLLRELDSADHHGSTNLRYYDAWNHSWCGGPRRRLRRRPPGPRHRDLRRNSLCQRQHTGADLERSSRLSRRVAVRAYHVGSASRHRRRAAERPRRSNGGTETPASATSVTDRRRSSLNPRGFAPRTPPHALSLAASPARSVRVARSRRSLAFGL
jgi:hypothetical protein